MVTFILLTFGQILTSPCKDKMQILKKHHYIYRLVPKVTLLYCAIFSTLDHLDPNNKPKRDFGKEIRSNFELWPLCVGSNLQILRKNTVLILDLFPGSSSFIVPIFVRIGRVILKWQAKNGNLLLALPPLPFDIFDLFLWDQILKNAVKGLFTGSSSFTVSIFVRIGYVTLKRQTKILLVLPPPLSPPVKEIAIFVVSWWDLQKHH